MRGLFGSTSETLREDCFKKHRALPKVYFFSFSRNTTKKLSKNFRTTPQYEVSTHRARRDFKDGVAFFTAKQELKLVTLRWHAMQMCFSLLVL